MIETKILVTAIIIYGSMFLTIVACFVFSLFNIRAIKKEELIKKEEIESVLKASNISSKISSKKRKEAK